MYKKLEQLRPLLSVSHFFYDILLSECLDNVQGTSSANSPLFTMSADHDHKDDVRIPALFLFYYEGQKLLNRMNANDQTILRLSDHLLNPIHLFREYMHGRCCQGWRKPAKKNGAKEKAKIKKRIKTEL